MVLSRSRLLTSVSNENGNCSSRGSKGAVSVHAAPSVPHTRHLMLLLLGRAPKVPMTFTKPHVSLDLRNRTPRPRFSSRAKGPSLTPRRERERERDCLHVSISFGAGRRQSLLSDAREHQDPLRETHPVQIPRPLPLWGQLGSVFRQVPKLRWSRGAAGTIGEHQWGR